MLDKRDLSAIKELIDESLDAKLAANNDELERRLDAKWDAKLDAKLAANNDELERRLDAKWDAKQHESENAILEEMDRVRLILEEKIQKVDDKVERLDAYVRIAKIDGENARLAIETIKDHERRISKLESQIA